VYTRRSETVRGASGGIISYIYQHSPDEQGLAEATVAEREREVRQSGPGRWFGTTARTIVVALIFFMAGLGILWLVERI